MKKFSSIHLMKSTKLVHRSYVAYILRGDLNWKKSLKFQLLVEIFWTPSPPSSKKGPTNENVGISYLIVNKVCFFQNFNPPSPISSESRTSPIFTLIIDYILWLIFQDIVSCDLVIQMENKQSSPLLLYWQYVTEERHVKWHVIVK